MDVPSDGSVKNGSQTGDYSPKAPGLLEASPVTSNFYLLGTGDHPGMSLVTVPLTPTNCFGWSDDIINNLIAKGKEGFITGTLPRPNPVDSDYKLWIKIDAMIKAWIKNSISPDLQRAFAFAASSKALWKSIKDKYGQKNGVQLSKLKRTMTNLKQGTLTLTEYYTKIYEIIGEIEIIQPVCGCVCDAQQSILNRIDQDNMILFVKGLNDCYEAVRNQILLTDPLPTMSKAYSMVLQIEQQNDAYCSPELSVCNLDSKKYEQTKKATDKKRFQIDKKNMVCDFCKRKGHGRDMCSKLHGVPNWYKDLTNKRSAVALNAAGAHNTKKDPPQGPNELDLKAIMQAEVKKFLKEEQETPLSMSSCVFDYAGNTQQAVVGNTGASLWLLDSGASCHIATHKHVFSTFKPLSSTLKVYLPDGTFCSPKSVEQCISHLI